MKTLVTKILIVVITLTIISTINVNKINATSQLIKEMITEKLTIEEINGLLLIREEEKLAHEVYSTLYEKWNLQIFNNISQSESRHTNAIKVLLDEFEIEDPYIKGIGNYSNPKLKKLYDNLIKTGNKSIDDALNVGAIIEDLDIADLNKLIANTNNERILQVYNNLNRGSRNHIRAFINQMSIRNLTYKPQYITQTEFDIILADKNTRRGNKIEKRRNRGNRIKNGRGQNNCIGMNERNGNGRGNRIKNGKRQNNCLEIKQRNGNRRSNGMRNGKGQGICIGKRNGNNYGMRNGFGQN